MSKYAPGPWLLHEQPASSSVETLSGCQHYNEPYYAVVSADGDIVCDNGQYYAQDVSPENMILIAAAPDLLEAAESVMAWWDEHQYDTTGERGEYNVFGEDPDFVVLARAAITKARGESK